MKFIGYEKVMDTKIKGQPPGKILVKLRKGSGRPRWTLMSLEDYRRRSVIRPG